MGEAGEIAAGDRFVDRISVVRPLAHPTALVRRAAHGDDIPDAETKGDHLALRYECDKTREEPAVDPAHASAGDVNLTLGWLEKPRRNPEQRRFTRSIGAQQRGKLPLRDSYTHTLEGGVGSSGITCRDVFDRQSRVGGSR